MPEPRPPTTTRRRITIAPPGSASQSVCVRRKPIEQPTTTPPSAHSSAFRTHEYVFRHGSIVTQPCAVPKKGDESVPSYPPTRADLFLIGAEESHTVIVFAATGHRARGICLISSSENFSDSGSCCMLILPVKLKFVGRKSLHVPVVASGCASVVWAGTVCLGFSANAKYCAGAAVFGQSLFGTALADDWPIPRRAVEWCYRRAGTTEHFLFWFCRRRSLEI